MSDGQLLRAMCSASMDWLDNELEMKRDIMSNLILLGDSIFANSVYVHPGEPDVLRQLQEALPENWQATLLAVDGHCICDISRQLEHLSPDATHLALSVGGNDALGHIGFLSEGASSVTEVLERLARIADNFRDEYHRMLQQVLACGLPTIICTIYEGNLGPEGRIAATALKVFNDAILREAITAGVPVIDLRAVCSSAEDYANPIEPSAIGGGKIARAIASCVTHHAFERPACTIYR